MKFTNLFVMATLSQNFCKFQGFPRRITSFQELSGVEVKFQKFPGVKSKFQKFSRTRGIRGDCRNPGYKDAKIPQLWDFCVQSI